MNPQQKVKMIYHKVFSQRTQIVNVCLLFLTLFHTFQLEACPQEKVHLYTDHDFYGPSEKICLKAYVADTVTHQHSMQSRCEYVELISPMDMLVNRVMIRPTESGLFHGNLQLTKMIPKGYYTIRAYTRHMENLGDDRLFKKNIRIGNLSTAKVQVRETATQSRRSQRARRDDFYVSFFS